MHALPTALLDFVTGCAALQKAASCCLVPLYLEGYEFVVLVMVLIKNSRCICALHVPVLPVIYKQVIMMYFFDFAICIYYVVGPAQPQNRRLFCSRTFR